LVEKHGFPYAVPVRADGEITGTSGFRSSKAFATSFFSEFEIKSLNKDSVQSFQEKDTKGAN